MRLLNDNSAREWVDQENESGGKVKVGRKMTLCLFVGGGWLPMLDDYRGRKKRNRELLLLIILTTCC